MSQNPRMTDRASGNKVEIIPRDDGVRMAGYLRVETKEGVYLCALDMAKLAGLIDRARERDRRVRVRRYGGATK